MSSSRIPLSSESASGTVRLASLADAIEGTDTARVVTPAGLKAHTDALPTGGVSSWDDLTDKPAAFPPEVHTHVLADVTDYTAPDLSGYAAATHGHTLDETTDTATRVAMTPDERTLLGQQSGTNTGDQTLPTWTTIAGKPAVVAAGADAAAARTTIGAGISNLALGTTASTAKAGNYAPPAATATTQGIVELATTAETTAGSDTTRAVTPAGVAAAIAGVGGGVSDHGALSGLADDDHAQYHTDARGDARYSQLGHTHVMADLTDYTPGRVTVTDTPTAPAEGVAVSYFVTSAVVWPAGLVWSVDLDGGVAPTITGTALVSMFTAGGITRAVLSATFPA